MWKSDQSKVPNTQELLRNFKDIYLLELKEPCLLVFKVVMNQQQKVTFWNDEDNIFLKRNFFDVTTEFIPAGNYLVLQDYIQFQNSDEKSSTEKLFYKYVDNGENLVVESVVPNFKNQMRVDYSLVKTIRFIFTFYLIPSDGKELLGTYWKCGGEALLNDAVAKLSTERIIPVENLHNELKVAVKFLKGDLEGVQREKVFSVFINMEGVLIKDDNDYFGINLDEKQFQFLYGVLVIPNQYYDHFMLMKMLGILVVILFLGCFYTMWQRGRKKMDEEIIYIRKNAEENRMRGQQNPSEQTV